MHLWGRGSQPKATHDSLSFELGGLDNNLGTDLVRLQLSLHVPPAYNCLNFDFAFYSEEFPEFVGTIFNDTFTAQLNNPSLTVDGQSYIVDAPGNFAFDTQNNIISINTAFGVVPNTATTYDGSTPSLRASAVVTPNSNAQVERRLIRTAMVCSTTGRPTG